MTTLTVKLIGGPCDGAESDVCREHPPLFVGIIQGKDKYAVYERVDDESVRRYRYLCTTHVEPINVITENKEGAAK